MEKIKAKLSKMCDQKISFYNKFDFCSKSCEKWCEYNNTKKQFAENYSRPQYGADVIDTRRLDAPVIKVQKQCPRCKNIFYQ